MKELAVNNEQCQCIHGQKDIFDARLYKNEILLHQQLFLQRPIHDRRTLDQSYFYNLRKVAYRDDDQVIGQHTLHYEGEQQDNQRKMMMVDQLWMWIIDGNTIVTSFPETGIGKRNEADVLQKILSDLKPSLGQSTKSLNGLVALIIDTCTGIFHRSDIPPDLAFFEFFADEIGTAKSEVDDLYTSFYRTSQSIETLWTDPNISTLRMTVELDSLFSIKDEVSLLRRIEKIISDLHKIDFLSSQQTDVLYSLAKPPNRTSRSLTDIFETAKHRRRTWADMADSARAVQESLQGLLDLKQRQANVSEARTVRYQVEISARQGRSIMVLTVVTILFLPVSVIAAIFGMNAWELNEGELHFSTEMKVMVPVTLVVVLGALGMAFRERVRDLVVMLFRKVPL
jgi:CorA-like Mg2+ transporter protein